MFASVETAMRLAVLDIESASVEAARAGLRDARDVLSWVKAVETRLLTRLQQLNLDASRELSDATGASGKAATGRVKAANALSALPATLGALEAGEITPDHAAVLTKAVADNPAVAAKLKEHEGELVTDCGTVDDLTKRVRDFVTEHDIDPNAKALRQQAKRRGWFWGSDDDMDGISFLLPPDMGDEAKRELIAEARRLYREHENTTHDPSDELLVRRYSHYLADALLSLIRRANQPASSTAVSRPNGAVLAVHPVGASAARFVNGTPLNVETARRMACTNGTIPVVVNSDGAVLYLGRNARLASPAQKTALQVMFTGCVICGAEWAWCHVHHVIPWDHGGLTDLDNLVPVCGHRCHTLVHEGGWKLKIPRLGTVEIYTPNGTLHRTIHANAPPEPKPRAA